MASSKTSTGKATLGNKKPTEFLLRADSGRLSPVNVYELTAKGFELKDVQEMLSISDLYSGRGVLGRILGKSSDKTNYQGKRQPVRLNSNQSAIAFLYASALECAIDVFGTQELAEEWLGRPCKYLNADAPLDLIDNALGFRIVQDYLKRIEYGVYQ